METLRSQHYETENANKENSSEFKFITKLGQSIQKLKENLKKFISAPEEEGSGLKEVPIEDDVQALVREFIEATDDLKDEYGLYSSSSGDSTPENHIIIPNQPILTQGINEMKKYVESNNHKDTGSYVGGINRILDQMLAEEPVETAQDTEGGKGEEYKFPGVEALQAALAEVVAEIPQQPNSATEGGKLARIEGEIHPDEGELETLDNSVEIEQLKQEARQAIQRYKEFADRHPPNLRTKSVQAAYRQLEKVSWDRVRELAYKLGGNISQELPQLRNILESHRDLKDSKDAKEYFLQKQKILVNEKGNITHIVDDEGNEFELNRPRTFEEIFNQSRPVHILYSTSEEGKKIGYVVESLNENTITWIETTLSGNTIPRAEIKDETEQPAAQTTEVVAPSENNFEAPKQSDEEETTLQNSNPHGNNTKNNPEASTEKEDPLESYRNKGFDKDQLAFIENAIDAGDTPEQIALYAKSEYKVAQMIVERAKKLNPELDISKYEGLPYWKQIWIIAGMRTGLNPEQIVLYLEKDISNDEIAEIQSYIESGLTIEKMIEKKIIEIAKGYLNGDIGFSRYSLIEQLKFNRFTDEQATQAIDSMDIDWKEQAIKKAKSYLQSRPEDNENWSRNELIQQLKFEEFTNDQAISAVNSITDYDWEEDSEVGEPEQSEGGANTPQGSLDDLRLAYARAEEAWNRKRGDEQLKDTFISAREAYNTELERVLKLQVAKGQADTISQMFKDEVIALRDSRTTQSQELQGKWEKGFNNAKEKFLGWATKNKTRWMLANMGLFAAGALLSSIGVGIPVTGALEMTRRSLGSVMAGVGSRNTLVGLMEDRDIKINKFGLNINFQAEVPKIVKESISEEDKIKAVSEDVLKERLGTLEAYYRLNGGKFTNDNQQQAYEKVLTELARRVQKNVIGAENPNLSIQQLTPEQLKKNKELHGSAASYELAKIAKSQNIDLSLLSREEYADFAIQNKLMIDDNQLRMSLWQRMCESVDEVRKGDKERQSLISPEADDAFNKFSEEIKQKAGENDKKIDDNIIVKHVTNYSKNWLFFLINKGVDIKEDQIFKSYISLQDLNTLTPDKFKDFMRNLRDSGYNGDIKVFQDLLTQGIRLNDQIVMHGASEEDAKLGLDVAAKFFGDSLADQSLGIDKRIDGKWRSHSKELAQKIKNSIQDSSLVEKQNSSTEFVESDKQKLETDRYTSELLNTISDKRIAELDKFRRKRQIANVVGFATTGVLGGLLLNDMLKPGGIFRPNIENGGESANNGVSTTQEVQSTGADTTSAESSPTPQASPTQSETPPTNVSTPEGQSPGVNTDVAGGTGTSSGVPKPNLETTTTTTPTGTGDAVEAAAKQAKELSRDVSRLDSGETIWGEITKQLGENASQSEIQQAVENYLQSELGQESLYKLAQQTEGGREFLARWSIDNAGEMARLELKDLYEVSKYLGEGELEGLTKLSLHNLDALSPAEYTAPSPLESPVNTSQFTKSLSEAIGANNLTDSQIGSVLEAYADTDQGRKSLYELIITSKANNPAISEILDRYNITYEAQLSDLPADQLNILAQKVGVENLNQLPGFKLNEIILSKFEDAPYMVDLARGTRPLDVVQRYIANELGNLPYDSNLGKQVLDTYVQTDAGKQWLYDAIVSNPNPNNQNVQSFREYLSYKGIKSAEDFKALFNWAEFSRNSNIPTSGFWNQIRLPNRNILQPLSTFLQPSKMIGIKDAVRQVLTG